jgi:hypothetical protein
VSAFILFLVQPIVGKIILPKLGGTPQVWNTCMVFFQMVLLAGYAYTHNASTRLTLRQQLLAHGVLLLLPLIVLLPFPFAFMGSMSGEGISSYPASLWGFVPDLGSNPIPSTLKILFMYVALPFLVVSTTAPLLQKWFVHTGHPSSKDPYFLYGASNFGSLLSLIAYPIVIEPYVSLKNQGWIYTIGYLLLGGFVLACAAMVWSAKDAKAVEPKPEPAPQPPPPPAPTPEAQTGITATAPSAGAVKPGLPPKPTTPRAGAPESTIPAAAEEVTFGRRFRWVMLAAIPSSLMLGITTHITTDLSPIPLFWLIPLILYLGSFILVFMRWPIVWTESPHTFFLFGAPFFVWFMIMADVWNLASSPSFIGVAIFAHVAGFFMVTMVCHGELAKDRPSTKYLTEFYLWMSVGGMLGGMFNGLVAPMVFPKLWELPLAIAAAGFVRPKMFESGLLDNIFGGAVEGGGSADAKGPKGKSIALPSQGPSESFVRLMDFAWPAVVAIIAVGLFAALGPRRDQGEGMTAVAALFIFGIPLLVACAFLTRPVRIGLSFAAVLLLYHVHVNLSDTSKYANRSYFGAISVKEWTGRDYTYRQLIHGHIDHGMNFIVPEMKHRGDPVMDKSRLATTYYHREGPVGRVMEKFNWFPDKENSNKYSADARMPASLLASAFGDQTSLGGGIPASMFVTAWSEPPIATVGLGTGTMASYGRPYQHVHFYEIDNQILRLSLMKQTAEIHHWFDYKEYIDTAAKRADFEKHNFNYLERAIERGCTVQVLMGDARLRMALPYKNHYRKDAGKALDLTDPGGGPEKFYHMMVVDAFSSDAIPAHLLTAEAFEMYFGRLVDEGVLCVHTSNRFVDLPKVVAAITAKMEWTDEKGKKVKYAFKRGHDNNTDRTEGHYTSEWVMVARKAEYIVKEGDTAFIERYRRIWDSKEENQKRRFEEFWGTVSIDDRYRWTDDYYNLLSVTRFFN